jgi:tripartite-type tricarboxylate transporter receptor subunit TctC
MHEMKMSFIKQLTRVVLLASLMISSVFAAYPDKPIKMMIGYAPGSSTDIVGRIIANDLSLSLIHI